MYIDAEFKESLCSEGLTLKGVFGIQVCSTQLSNLHAIVPKRELINPCEIVHLLKVSESVEQHGK